MIRTTIVALAAVSFVAALAACGKQAATLERPAPSPKERAAIAAQQRAEAANATNATEAGKPVPQQNPALTPYTNPGPIQDNPIPGEPSNPSGTPNPNPQ